MKVTIDQAEHKKMEQIFRDAGVEEIEWATLPYADYIIEDKIRFVVTFKTLQDFQRSFFNGHLMDEIYALRNTDGVHALIIADDKDKWVKKDVHIWANQHWLKRNFLIPTFKFTSREKAVRFMLDVAGGEVDYLQRKIRTDGENNTVVGFYMFYGIGEKTATKIAKKYPVPFDFIMAIDNGDKWWDDIDGMGKVRAKQIEALILEGKPIPRRERGGDF